MAEEREGPRNLVTSIHFDVIKRSVTFDVAGQPAARLVVGKEGLILETLLAAPAMETEPLRESQRTVTLTGRLKTKPREGKADRSGNHTAYARFTGHDPDRQGPHDYIATFHRNTAPKALQLAKNAQITVEGYQHPSGSDKRLDTLSVINLVNYPGKPQRLQG